MNADAIYKTILHKVEKKMGNETTFSNVWQMLQNLFWDINSKGYFQPIRCHN